MSLIKICFKLANLFIVTKYTGPGKINTGIDNYNAWTITLTYLLLAPWPCYTLCAKGSGFKSHSGCYLNDMKWLFQSSGASKQISLKEMGVI